MFIALSAAGLQAPFGGYKAGAPPEVADCDKSFTQMLGQLDTAWAKGDTAALDAAIGSMLTLKSQAIALLEKQIPRPEGGIYGPQFRKVTT